MDIRCMHRNIKFCCCFYFRRPENLRYNIYFVITIVYMPTHIDTPANGQHDIHGTHTQAYIVQQNTRMQQM
jgi:hypothetical protein